MDSVLLNFLEASGITFAISSLQVFLSWLFIYRRPVVKQLSKELEKSKSELEELQRNDEVKDEKKRAKRIKALQAQVQRLTGEYSRKTVFVSMLILGSSLIMNRSCASLFEGKVCAYLPFTPFPILTRFTHRGLESSDMTEAGFTFIYWATFSLFREILSNIFNFTKHQSNPLSYLMQQQQNNQGYR